MLPIKHFFGSYYGNKTKEYKYIKPFLPNDNKIMVEPFCGTFAISRLHYYDTDKFIVHINDLSIEIKVVVELIRDKFDDFTILLNNLKNNDDKNKLLTFVKDDDLKSYLKNAFMVRGMCQKPPKLFDYSDLHNYLKKIKFTNNDYKVILDLYKDNEEAFLFCDPPYFDSRNSNYNTNMFNLSQDKVIKDNTIMYVDLAKYFKECKCKIMLVVNDNNLMRYIFDGYVKSSYDVIYQICKKKTKHLIITNYE
jgi:site-specific DNA-adenine methylase